MSEKAIKERKQTILVADDQGVIRDMVRAILKGLGFENVLYAENGAIAIQIIASNQIDLVICDWNMPLLTGIDVLRKIRSDERYRAIPFLMLTAEAYRENVVEAMQMGVSDYISKPFTAEVLVEKIEKLLKL